MLPTSELWKSRLPELEAKYIITNRILLVKSIAVLTVVIIFFFVANLVDELHFDIGEHEIKLSTYVRMYTWDVVRGFPSLSTFGSVHGAFYCELYYGIALLPAPTSLLPSQWSVMVCAGWIALFGAMTLLILSNIEDLENILEKVEWGTLLFFAGLFVLMELLAELGLINFIADVTVGIIEVSRSGWEGGVIRECGVIRSGWEGGVIRSGWEGGVIRSGWEGGVIREWLGGRGH